MCDNTISNQYLDMAKVEITNVGVPPEYPSELSPFDQALISLRFANYYLDRAQITALGEGSRRST